MKTVAIVGAGPSGLVTAKTLLRSTTCNYKVTVFEKSAEVGGLWAVHRDRPYDGMLNPNMPTNLSRFNIGFSDLAWSSVGLQGHVPYWPRAWQVGQYLRAYTEKYIPGDCILFNTKVKQVTTAESDTGERTWNIQWETSNGHGSPVTDEGIFDYLVIGTGFFGTSSCPSLPEVEGTNIKVAHSTETRVLSDVLPSEGDVAGTLLVVGGGMSGADVSTVLASQISDAKYAPSGNENKYSKLQLVQLCPAPAYALPLASPCDKDESRAPHFLPLDLCMYDLGGRPPGDIEMNTGQMNLDAIKNVHSIFQGLVGDQSELGAPGLTFSDDSRTAYVTLTEQYSGLIRDGDIKIVTGRFKQLQSTSDSGQTQIQATYEVEGQQKTIDDIVGLVYATGFTPQPSLEFLSSAIRKDLEHDQSNNRLPVLLDEHATLHSKIPSLAIIGFHEGAFWGSLEMEARLAERRWSEAAAAARATTTDSSPSPSTSPSPSSSTSDDTTSTSNTIISRLKLLREAMVRKDGNIPQYWMGDYVGFMETLARDTGVTRNDLDLPTRTGPVAVSRYTDPSSTMTTDRAETEKTLTEFSHLLHDSRQKSLFVGRATFLALQGRWTIDRTITSSLSTMPSGTLSGHATFHPRFPTHSDYDFEYLYIERGSFVMDNNPATTMTASRRYVWRYQEKTDKVSVWFVKDDNDKRRAVDYLYHNLDFDLDDRKDGWRAKADHLCVNDMYRSDYRFRFRGANLDGVDVDHRVKGPKKDYISRTRYVRPS